MSMTQIADHLGVTKQAISCRLKSAGIRARPTRSRRPQTSYERAILEKLYVSERLTVKQFAEPLGSTPGKILFAMNAHGTERRKRETWATKYPQLKELKVGDSVDMPSKANWCKPAVQYYVLAKKAGIRVSTRMVDPETMRVARIE
jgi:hypothetical protein